MNIRHAGLVTALLLCCSFGSSASTAADPVPAELDRVQQLYRAITAYHVLLQGEGVSKELIHSALFDVERYVEELDGHLATNKLFIDDLQALERITAIVAKAHLQAALLHAKGVDLESSIEHYEQVVELLEYDPSTWTESIERGGMIGLLPEADELVFEMASPASVIGDLERFWSSGVITRFFVRDFGAEQLDELTIERIGGSDDGFSMAAFEVAKKYFEERVQAGLDQFRIVLPAGKYEIRGSAVGGTERKLLVRQGQEVDPVLLSPHTFRLAFAGATERCRPSLSLNGMIVDDLDWLPFGTFRLTANPRCRRWLPDKIVVEQKSRVTTRTEPERLDRVKKGQPIFLFVTTPADSTYTLRL